MDYQMVTWPITSRLKGQTRDHNALRAQYLENSWISRLRSKGPPIGSDMGYQIVT